MPYLLIRLFALLIVFPQTGRLIFLTSCTESTKSERYLAAAHSSAKSRSDWRQRKHWLPWQPCFTDQKERYSFFLSKLIRIKLYIALLNVNVEHQHNFHQVREQKSTE